MVVGQSPSGGRFFSKLGVASQSALENGHDHVLAVDIPGCVGAKRYWTAVDTTALYAAIEAMPRGKRNFYEVLHDDGPCRVYLDFDMAQDEGSVDGVNITMDQPDVYVKEIIDGIIAFMWTHYKVEQKLSDILVMDSSSNEKLSFHMLLPFTFRDDKQRAEFKARLMHFRAMKAYERQSKPYATGWIFAIKGSPDSAPYGKSQCFRMLGCCKPGKPHLVAVNRVGAVLV